MWFSAFVVGAEKASGALGPAGWPVTLLATLALGFFLGVRHATDADHVVAVTTIVSRERSARGAVAIGALWGLGHTATILIVGGAIVVFGLVIPPRLGLSMEMGVAVMLVLLGAMNVSGAMKRIREAAHPPSPESAAGAYAGTPVIPAARGREAGRAPRTRGLVRPLVVGVVHGLAGSAAVALLVLATIRRPTTAMLYLAIFGGGTVLGMMALTAGMAIPMTAVAARLGSFDKTMARMTGVVSIAFGLFLAYHIGIVDGLLGSQPHWTPR